MHPSVLDKLQTSIVAGGIDIVALEQLRLSMELQRKKIESLMALQKSSHSQIDSTIASALQETDIG